MAIDTIREPSGRYTSGARELTMPMSCTRHSVVDGGRGESQAVIAPGPVRKPAIDVEEHPSTRSARNAKATAIRVLLFQALHIDQMLDECLSRRITPYGATECDQHAALT
jgi:hypothetical protein